MHADAVKSGDRVVIIDDLLATGGTAVAACNLVKKAGADVVSTAFIIELDPLKGREKIEANGVKVVSMLNYDLD
jgi:adenine phosphoribosyltransferase